MKKHLIVIDRPLNSKAGGGCGYLYKLNEGLQSIENKSILVVSRDLTESEKKNIKIRRNIKSKVPAQLLKLWRKLNALRYYYHLKQWRNHLPSREVMNKIEAEEYDSIHVHHPFEFISVYNYLKANQIENKMLILTNHDPGLTSQEIYRSFLPVSKYIAHKIQIVTEEIELEAFKNCDALVFPSEQSMSYYSEWKYFNSLVKSKKHGFVLTGTDPYTTTLSRSDFLKQHGIDENNIVFSFVGRHNEIKGYDILKAAARMVMKSSDNISFLIAGEESPMKGLKNNKWKEIGWTDKPGDVVNASDVFIAPNRKAYFDLVILEAMSLGKVILATKTGGTIRMAELSRGIILVDTEDPDELSKMILRLSQMSKIERVQLGTENLNAYKEYFTLENFASSYEKVVTCLKGDFFSEE